MDLNRFGQNAETLKAFQHRKNWIPICFRSGGQTGYFGATFGWIIKKNYAPLDRSKWILLGIEFGKGFK